ncbi:MAG: AmmeMemoRadiSam system protein B [Planctomycetes bacterium]|nr:AmmeMemoRadiSam system protein B [Planctomycetota bacterium]
MTSSESSEELRPRLRPVEAVSGQQDGRPVVLIHDPSGLAAGVVTLSPPAFFIVARFDGEHAVPDVQAAVLNELGQFVARDQIDALVEQLDQAGFLESERFERRYAEMAQAYTLSPTRPLSAEIDGDELAKHLAEIASDGEDVSLDGRVVGLIAPHLDYARGMPCYTAAYGVLARLCEARRFIILGTNHFGRSLGPVATDRPFETPLGTTPVDQGILSALGDRVGDGLFRYPMDHQGEHSVEVQAMVLQKLFGAEAITISPLLCCDGCMPPQPGAVSLADLGEALRGIVSEADEPVCVIASADLSHVGRRFGDDCDVDDVLMDRVEAGDHALLQHVAANQPDALLNALRDSGNPTRVCSSGCISAALRALPGATVHMLGYHQAVTPDADTAVTCTAAALTV